MKKLGVLITVVLVAAASRSYAQELILTNPIDVDRVQEVIELPLQQVLDHLHLAPAQAGAIVAEDAATHARGPGIGQIARSSKLDATPDQLLLLVHLTAKGRERIRFRVDANAAKIDPLVFGREAPERKDDFAWENQDVAYRVYGPALEATGEITSGIDVWSKRIPNFVIDSFYKRDAEGARTHNPALSYHKDNGVGLDSYEVGKSRGCTAGRLFFADGKLMVSKNYTKLHMLSDGPIRFAFEVTYAPWVANGVTVTETKRITLDAGTHMNRIESTYTFDGGQTLDLAAAIASCTKERARSSLSMAVAISPPSGIRRSLASAGRISTGLVADPQQHAKTISAARPCAAGLHAPLRRALPRIWPAPAGRRPICLRLPIGDNYLKLELEMLEHPIAARSGRSDESDLGGWRRTQSGFYPVDGAPEFVDGLEKVLGRPIARRAPGRKPAGNDHNQLRLL